MVSQEGIVVEVPKQVVYESVESLAAYLKPRLELAAGGNLDAYRQ